MQQIIYSSYKIQEPMALMQYLSNLIYLLYLSNLKNVSKLFIRPYNAANHASERKHGTLLNLQQSGRSNRKKHL